MPFRDRIPGRPSHGSRSSLSRIMLAGPFRPDRRRGGKDSRNSQSNPGARSDPSTEAWKLETSYFLEGAKILGICNASCVRRARSSYIGVWHSFLPDGYDSAIRNGWHVNAPPSQNRTMDWCPPDQARSAGFTDWVLAGVRRERIERIARRVYRIPYLPPGRFLLYREALLRANA
jgi:hypothetical protein